MPDALPQNSVLRVADLSQTRPTAFHLTPEDAARAEIATSLGVIGIRKLSFTGTVRAEGKTDWRLDAKLGATVEQSCVVTLEPVVTRIDQPVTRRFLGDLPTSLEEEIEIPDDDSEEALGPEIDLVHVLTEALALALPDYPRRDDAELGQSEFSAPGVTPITDTETKPFAGLAQFKNRLEKGE